MSQAAASEPALSTTQELIDELKAGRPVVMVDNENRENEGDIIIPADLATQEILAFTIRYTGGVICLAMTNKIADHLELPPMVEHNSAPRKTAYTVSVEARTGVDTGISAKDRATTIRATVKEGVTAADPIPTRSSTRGRPLRVASSSARNR